MNRAQKVTCNQLSPTVMFTALIVVAGWIPSRLVAVPERADRPALHGTVLDAAGNPVGGASIIVILQNSSDAQTAAASAQSDANGEFTVDDPRSAPKDSSQPPSSQPLIFAQIPGVGISQAVPMDSVGSNIDLKLQAAADFDLTVLGPDAKPAANLSVRPILLLAPMMRSIFFLPKDVSAAWAVRSDASGKCVFHGFPAAGQVRVDVESDQYAVSTINLPLGGTPQTLELAPAGSLSGTVRYGDSAQPAAGIGVYAAGNPRTGVNSGNAVTDAQGRFEIRRLASGMYTLSLDLLRDTGEWTAAPVTAIVVPGQSVQADLTLIHGGLISGTVRDADTHQPLAGAAVGSHDFRSLSAAIHRTVTASDGTYQLRLPPGEQYVFLQQSPDGYRSLNAKGSNISIAEGQRRTVDFEVPANGPLYIVGRVLKPDGNPAAGAVVQLTEPKLPPMTVQVSEGADSTIFAGHILTPGEIPTTPPVMNFGSVAQSVRTDGDGRFHFNHVSTDAKVSARFGTLATTTALAILDSPRDLTLRLSDVGLYTLVLHVADRQGNPVIGATVSLVEAGGGMAHSNPVGPEGNLRLDSISSDAAFVIIANAPGYGVVQTPLRPGIGAGPLHERLVNVILEKADSLIAGTIVDDQGVPVFDVVVSINGVKTGIQETKTDAAGRFSFNVVSGATASLVVLPPRDESGAPPRPLVFAKVKAGQTDLKLVAKPPAQ